ncbi:cytidine deaminase [Verrucomicrobiaceae bacterium N1E253]|uniref:Cytidine deaminase n=1 Tax=Oceaniferula marina TaxID=2748318 RepID=A0A851GQ20_9BACT|nr:cytidine deaminase [Oceaniferula marina]NWK57097.1 cytidine deaminase [Oceaniferula marina]
MTDDQLFECARQARERAYAPYSGFFVGAALLTMTGEVFSGCNIENASYGLSQCAERVALGNAIAHGSRQFQTLALCLQGDGSPCGACRQALNEFAPELTVLIGGPNGNIRQRLCLNELLPNAFGPQNLKTSSLPEPRNH